MAQGTSLQPAHDGSGGTRGLPRVGRRVGSIVFWCGVVYMLAAAFYSITLQVFHESPAETRSEECVPALRELKVELLDQASTVLAEGGASSPQPIQEWFERWDSRHADLRSSCAQEHGRTHAMIRRFRHSLETALLRLGREQRPLLDELDRDLGTTP